MTLERDRDIIRATLRDPETLACPMCPATVEAPTFHAPHDALADALGAGSGEALGRMWAVQHGRRAAEQMRRHLATHTPDDWLAWRWRFLGETPQEGP